MTHDIVFIVVCAAFLGIMAMGITAIFRDLDDFDE